MADENTPGGTPSGSTPSSGQDPWAPPPANPWAPTQPIPTQPDPYAAPAAAGFASAEQQPTASPAADANPYAQPYPGPAASAPPQQQPPQAWSGAAWTPPPAASGQAPGWAVPPTAAQPTPAASPASRFPRDASALSALFDFSFTQFATPRLVQIVYLLTVIAAVGGWLLSVLAGFGAQSYFGGGSGILTLLFGWIPALLTIALARFLLEGVVALIRIHDRVTEIAARDEPTSQG